MKKHRILCLAVSAIILSGCSIFGRYSEQTQVPEGLFGPEMNGNVQENSVGDIPWKNFFPDPVLQDLIDTALARNVDLAVAKLRVEEAEAALTGAKLGFLPSLAFTPSFTILKNPSYDLPIGLEWSNQGLGSIINRKREAQALASRALDARDAVQSRLVASVAEAYYQLQMLDRQLEIMNSTESVWTEVYETQKSLMENGKSYSTSVNQMEAALTDVRIQKKDTENQIKDTEYYICLILGQTPGEIERSGWMEYEIPEYVGTGVPARLLDRRPDVKVAGKDVEAAYYVSRQALGAMFPSLSLSGMLGWTTQGVTIKDPAQMVFGAIASLAQPIFARGQLSANYKISKLQQEEAARNYTQTLLSAGNEVNKSLRECQLAKEKDVLYKHEVEVLQDAYSATRELMSNGKASYIEVLVAQDGLLKAQLGEAVNIYNGTISLVALYIALGGGI